MTAATLTSPLKPLIFSRERRDLAVNARDYVTLCALEINRSGHRVYYWFGYLWSTIDRRAGEPILAPGEELVLIADGRPIALRRDTRAPSDAGIGDAPIPVPKRRATALLYSASTEEIAYIARADELRIELIGGGASEPFIIWQDARTELRAFAERIEEQ